MDWWTWVLIGLVLIALELFVAGGFFLLLIGLAFVVTGGAVALGASHPLWLPWAICSLLVTGLLLFVRRPLLRMMGLDDTSRFTELAAEEIKILETIHAGAVGQGELRGSVWKVRNVGTSTLHPGERCSVIKIDGLTVETKGS